ncbi:hypothetical protein B9G55_03530 [Saccharibacillus sp. O16]|nr:hypothetical protein B9G55_03530 [Saccharibacillus sp. O16]
MSKRTKIILLAVLVVLILLSAAYLYYMLSMQKRTAERDAAITRATQQAQLTEVSQADKWVWGDNSIFWVIQGKNAAGEEEYVWLKYKEDGTPAEGQNSVFTLPLAGTVIRDDMTVRFKAELPEAKPLRILPGIYASQYVWQIFYQQGDMKYYRFYSMKDGAAVGKTVELPDWK